MSSKHAWALNWTCRRRQWLYLVTEAPYMSHDISDPQLTPSPRCLLCKLVILSSIPSWFALFLISTSWFSPFSDPTVKTSGMPMSWTPTLCEWKDTSGWVVPQWFWKSGFRPQVRDPLTTISPAIFTWNPPFSSFSDMVFVVLLETKLKALFSLKQSWLISVNSTESPCWNMYMVYLSSITLTTENRVTYLKHVYVWASHIHSKLEEWTMCAFWWAMNSWCDFLVSATSESVFN